MKTVPGTPAQVAAGDVEAARPLTEAQRGLWYAQRLDASNPVFNTAQAVTIDGPLDVEAFRAAVNGAMAEADALAVRCFDTADGPRQIVDQRHRASLAVWTAPSDEDADEWAEAKISEDLRTPIDLNTQSPAAQWLLIVGRQRYIWYQRLHHLAIDGYGTNLLTARICDLYSSCVQRLPQATQPFGRWADVLEADQAYEVSSKRDRDRSFWLSDRAGAPPVVGMAPGAPLSAHSYRRTAVEWPAELGPALREVASAADAGWPDVVTALSAAYVARHVGSDDVTLGVAVMNRLGTPAARVPCMAMNVLPMRTQVEEDAPLAEWLASAAARFGVARRHGRYRSERIRGELGLLGGERRIHGPLVNILPFDAEPHLAGVSTSLRVLATGPVDDLTFTVRADASLARIHAEVDANPTLYSAADLEAHARRWTSFVHRALTSARLADVPTLTSDEHVRWIAGVNDTARDVEQTTLDALFARTAMRTPSAPAVRFGGQRLSYAALEAAADTMAAGLRGRGVQRGDIVGVALPRSMELAVALRAILKVGAAYLPLDFEQPLERLSRLLTSAHPALTLIRDDTAGRLPAEAVTCDVRCLAEPSSGAPRTTFEGPAAADAAYVIYTSGSTGEPKGVVIEHRSIVNRLLWMQAEYAVGAGDRILQKTPITFDVSVWELFLPWLSGAELVMAPPALHKDPRALAEFMTGAQITLAHFVPSMLEEFLSESAAAAIGPRAVFCSGEALPAALRDRFHRVLDAELHNLYGPTEAAVDVTAWPAGPDDHSDPVPIGRPVWNTRAYVLDQRCRPLPPGVVGHLYLAGAQLAREYLGRPDLTEERFVPDPFGGPGDRMYRTGDLARWRADGVLEFLGRSDHQIKIRGQRVELGEVEAAIAATGAVERSVATAREDAATGTRIVAYVEPRDTDAFDEGVLLREIAVRLPAVMMPSAVVVMEEWPTTPNGKLDRSRLPAPARSIRPSRAGLSRTESRVTALFAEVLGLDASDIGAESDFFALGGHSLLAARLTRVLRETLAVDAGLGVIFTQPTVSALASWVERHRSQPQTAAADEGLEVVFEWNAASSSEPPLVCVHPAGGISWCYGPLARALQPRRVLALQARGLRSVELPASLDVLAADYVAEVRARQPQGPYHLLGWSVGGIIAHAMAVHLEASGERVALLAVLDAYPSDRWRTAAEPTEAEALRALLLMAGQDRSANESTLTRAGVLDRLRGGRHPLGALSDDALSGVLRVVRYNNGLVRRHHHGLCAAPMIHFTAVQEHAGSPVTAEEWRPYVGGLEIVPVDARHAQMTGVEVSRLVAAVLAQRSRT